MVKKLSRIFFAVSVWAISILAYSQAPPLECPPSITGCVVDLSSYKRNNGIYPINELLSEGVSNGVSQVNLIYPDGQTLISEMAAQTINGLHMAVAKRMVCNTQKEF